MPATNVTPLVSAAAGKRTSAAISDKSARKGACYLGNGRQQIHRHTESIDINADQTACWRLRIDLELPTDHEAQCGTHNDEVLYLFPLLFLRKSVGRTGFKATDEQGADIPLPNRGTSDRVSALAAATLASRLLKKAEGENGRSLPSLSRKHSEHVEHIFESICVWRAYDSSVILNHLQKNLDPDVLRVWFEAGLMAELEMLVDHSLVWVPLRGLPGERRAIEVSSDTELLRRPLRRWHFGELERPRPRRFGRLPRIHWLRARRWADRSQVLNTGKARYGRLASRISLSVLGERFAKPLGWLPIAFDFPTIYTRRCRSYHFEMNCPRGLSPRELRVAVDLEGEAENVSGRTTILKRAAHVYLPRLSRRGDVVIRATVGIGPDVFPFLWLMMGAITTAMLWALVGFNPNWLVAGDSKSHNEIAAAVLLLVPALLGVVIASRDEDAVSSLISGARILVLIAGLSCAAATAVLIKVEPFSTKPQATWAVCAAIATAATVPMATSWLRSMPTVWGGLGMLKTVGRQYVALGVQVGLAFLIAVLLEGGKGGTASRAGLAVCLLILSVTLTLLATSRLPIQKETSRRFVSVGAMIAAVACLVLGCVELQWIFAPNARWQIDVESVQKWIILLAPATGILLWAITRIFGAGKDELSISPQVGKELIAGERIRELRRLRELDSSEDEKRFWDLPRSARSVLEKIRDEAESSGQAGSGTTAGQGVTVEPVGKSEADWSWGARSSAGLPEFVEGEFTHMIDLGKEGAGEEGEDSAAAAPPDDDDFDGSELPLEPGSGDGKDAISERDRVIELGEHMDALLEIVGNDREAPADRLAWFLGRFDRPSGN